MRKFSKTARGIALGISAGGLVGSLITAVAGAAALLFLVGLFKKA